MLPEVAARGAGMIGLFWTRLKPVSSTAAGSRRRRSLDRVAPLSICVELLEDRVLLSGTAIQAAEVSYEDWRELSFTVNPQTTGSGEFGAHVEDVAGISSAQSSDLIGLPDVFASTSYRGAGYSVAIIDTGIDYNHTSLGGGWGNRVVAGYDFVNNDGDPMDDNGHGTHVAGIVGSSHATYTGIAPEIDLIGLKVLSSSGSGSFGDVEDALQWVIANQATYNIAAVNLSLGSGNYTIDPFVFLNDEFTSLKAQDVFISVSSGNGFYTHNSVQGMGAPAISPHTVSVGAVWDANVGSVSWSSGARDFSTDADRITSFTQRSSDLDILAPGAFVTNTYLGGGFSTLGGTSMAAPMIAGAAALLHQALEDTGQSSLANQDDILDLMQTTGMTVNDGDDEDDNVTNTGLNFQRLDLAAAIEEVTLPDFITRSGDTLDVFGTTGDDTFEFAVGSEYSITVNGESINFDAASIATINFHGDTGDDSITITGSTGDDAVVFTFGSVDVTGTGFAMNAADIENVSVFTGGGSDTAAFYDSLGNDRFRARPTFSQMTGTGFFHYAEGFARVDGYVTLGGDDRAFLFDAAGDELLTATPTEASIVGAGFDNHAHDFGRVLGYATAGGNDRVEFYDGNGADRFVARPAISRMTGANYNNSMWEFDEVDAVATVGDDRVSMFDSAGDDTLNISPTLVQMSGIGFSLEASGFGRAVIAAKFGGYDEAYMTDSSGDDNLVVSGNAARMTGSGFNNFVRLFDFVRATSSEGGTDTLNFDSFDNVFESVGDWI